MWEYAALFDVQGPTALELAAHGEDWWRREGCDLRVGRMGYRTNTILAGDTLIAEIHPTWGRRKSEKVRAAKKNLTPERIRKYNTEKAKLKLELLLDNNFSEDDLSTTLTYTEQPTMDEIEKDVTNFIARVKRARKKRGLPEMKYVYAIEDEKDGRSKDLHCHIVMSGGIDRMEIEKIWRKGSRARGFANCDRLQPDREGLRRIAFYIYEQNRGKKLPKGKRHYSCSRNLEKPLVRSSMSKVSNARVRRMARDFNAVAKDVMEKVYPGYEFIRGLRYQECEGGGLNESCVRFSDYTEGVYIRVMMRRIREAKRE